MHFLKKKQRRILDLRGNLILTFNAEPVAANVLSAAPELRFGLFVVLPKTGRLRATLSAIKFIWGPSQARPLAAESKTVRKSPAVGPTATKG